MKVRMVQHAVGQGGLFAGTLTNGGPSLRWAYDCGSNQSESLIREVGRVVVGGPLDLLFLSHLDSDHINGVDRLLTQCPVREVVLPYLEPEVVIATLARDAEQERLNGLFLDAAPDIAAWLTGRGVQIVTFIRGGDDETPGPPALPPPEGDGEGEISASWAPPPQEIGRVPSETVSAAAISAIVREVTAEAALTVRCGRATLDWALIPHVHTLSSARRIALVAFEREFGSPLDVRAIAQAARTKPGRERLRRCYDALWIDHNLVSMALYSGPLRGGDLVAYYPKLGWVKSANVAWMLTGDAHLERASRRDNFRCRYQRVLQQVGALMLPHHGARANFHPALLDLFPDLDIAFAAAGTNVYGHPHDDVRRAVEVLDFTRFVKVGEDVRSSLTMVVERS